MKDFTTMSRYSQNWENQKESKKSGSFLRSVVLLFSLMIFTVASSWAQCTPAEVDALFSVTVDGQPGDWNSLHNAEPPALTYSHIIDPFGSGVVDDQFTQGSKDFDFIADQRWANGQTKNKNDIANAAGFLESVECDGQMYTRLFFAGDRLSTNGTSQIGMWFYQGGVAPIEGTNLFEGEHVGGDILALINFVGGGSTAQIEIYSWNDEGTGDYGNGNLDLEATGAHRAVQIQVGDNVPDGWPFPADQYEENQFFEGFIDIGVLMLQNPEIDACFNRFLIEGRSSQTLNAALDDFANGELNIKPTVTVNSVAVCDGETATLTATPGSGSPSDYEFHWKDPQGMDIADDDESIDVTEAGDYTVTISYKSLAIDCESDEATGTVTVYDLPELVIDYTNVTCYNDGDGSVIVPENDYSLVLYRSDTENGTYEAVSMPDTDSDGNFINLGPGWYYVEATESHEQEEGDPVECTADSNKVEITQPDELDVVIDTTNVTCYNDGDGIVSIESSSGDIIRYELYLVGGMDNPIQTNTDGSNFENLGPGDYYVKVFGEDGQGEGECEAQSDTESIEEPDELDIVIDTSNVTCYDDGDGIVSIESTSGDIIRYELYLVGGMDNPIATNTTGADFEDLGPGDYYVKVFGEDGQEDGECEAQSDTESIEQPDEVLVAGTGFDPTCENLSGGYINVTASGYDRLELWSSPDGIVAYTQIIANVILDSDDNITGLGAGYYIVKAFANGGNGEEDECTAETDPIILTEPVCDEEACTLGYWKNHTDRWCRVDDGDPESDFIYETCELYSEVFGIDFSAYDYDEFIGLTLLDALNLEGGGVYNLLRQSVAALLNICHDEIGYPYSGDLFAAVQEAFENDTEGALASELDMINNMYPCPMDGSSATTASTCSNGAIAPAATTLSSEPVEKGDIKLSPNPFRDILTITYDFDYTSDVVIQVFSGQTLLRTFTDSNVTAGSSTEIDLGAYPSQMFVIRVITNKEIISKQASK